MPVYLYTSYYTDPDPKRQAEIDRCANLNAEAGFAKIIDVPGRPTFLDFFNAINHNTSPTDVNVIANSDIYFDAESIAQMEKIEAAEMWALTRHEAKPTGVVFEQSPESQDVWVFRGKIRIPRFCAFPLGKPGCDNRIAAEMLAVGYHVSNPCRDVKAYHLHNSHIRRYTDAERIPKPYLSVYHVTLDQRYGKKARLYAQF